MFCYCLQLKGRKMILQTEGASIATRSMSTSVDGNGDFCFKVPPGVHTIQVIGCILNALVFENYLLVPLQLMILQPALNNIKFASKLTFKYIDFVTLQNWYKYILEGFFQFFNFNILVLYAVKENLISKEKA